MQILYFYHESLLPFYPEQVKLPLQVNRFVQNFSRKEFSLEQNVHSEIRVLMRKFDSYEFRLFCRLAGRFLCSFVVMIPKNVGRSREYSTCSILT